MIRSTGAASAAAPARAPRGGFLLQGVLVALSNPKTLLFFGAFFPQFIVADQPIAPQLFALTGTFLLLAIIFGLTAITTYAQQGRHARGA